MGLNMARFSMSVYECEKYVREWVCVRVYECESLGTKGSECGCVCVCANMEKAGMSMSESERKPVQV